MKFSRIFIFVFACFMAISHVKASPAPDFWKELERAGQRVRDAVISAGPAVDVIKDAQGVWNGGRSSESEE